MPASLKDIAKDLDLSVVTVSKVLRGQSDISAETKERVLRRMRELNYKPNLAARSLATGRTCCIGLVVPSLLHPFFAEVAYGISNVIRAKGYGLLISASNEDEELERREIEQLLARQVDALVIASSQSSAEFLRSIHARKASWILIDRRLPGAKAHFIGVDDREIGRIATEHLIEAGCRRIAHIRGPRISTGEERMDGYRTALARARMRGTDDLVVRAVTVDHGAEKSGYAAMRELLRRKPHPDAVFCYNDPVAAGAMEAILENGLRVGHDIAVVGCGNSRWAGLLRVPLSSVDQGATRIGERAAQLALETTSARTPGEPQIIVFPVALVARESSRRPPRPSAK